MELGNLFKVPKKFKKNWQVVRSCFFKPYKSLLALQFSLRVMTVVRREGSKKNEGRKEGRKGEKKSVKTIWSVLVPPPLVIDRSNTSSTRGVDLEFAGSHIAWDWSLLPLSTLFVTVKTRGARGGFG